MHQPGTTRARQRAYKGPVLFARGFRVFFLGGALWAALAMALWAMMLAAGLELPARLVGAEWHLHEMLFGFTLAVLAGFLLTAVPNWTGRLPVMGLPVAALAALWLAGRVAMAVSALLPLWPVWALALAFPLALVLLIGREIVAGRNWRNLKVLAGLALFALAEALFLAEALNGAELGGLGLRLGVAAIVWLIALIGGRVVPSFTGNWLARITGARPVAPPGRFDALVMIVGALALALWVVAPFAPALPALALLAGALHLARLMRWRGWLAWREPLVWVLHLAYLFIPVGFFMLAADPGAAPHGWTAGAVGLMTLAMMSRASLGHSGRMLTAGAGLTALYLMVLLAALLRIAAAFLPGAGWLPDAAALFWVLGFGGFAWLFWPLFCKPPQAR